MKFGVHMMREFGPLHAPDDGGGAGGGGGGAADGGSAPPAASVAGEPAAPAGPSSVLSGAVDPDKGGGASASEGDTEAKPSDKPEGDAKPEGDKPEGEKEGEEKEGDKGDDKPTPPDYSTLNLPEGFNAESVTYKALTEVGAKHNVAPEVMQDIINDVSPHVREMLEQPYETWADLQEEWVGQIKADPDLGGSNFEKNLGYAAKFIDKFGNDDLRQALAFTGAGNHPEVVRAMVNAGKALSEGKFVTGNQPPVPKNTAAKMYPSLPSEN